MPSVKRIAQKLKEKVKSEEQYNFVESEQNGPLQRAQLLISDYRTAQRLKEMVIEEYQETDLEEIVNSSVISNQYGKVLHNQEEVTTTFPKIGSKERILHDLKLIYGIGPVREQKLKAKGFKTIQDLCTHKKWGEKADALLKTYQQNPKELHQTISRRKSASDPLVLELSDFYDSSDFAILDIETMGLSNQPIILLGVGFPTQHKLHVHQFLLKDVDQEVAALQAFSKEIRGKEVLLTYNGKSFDLPYIKRRLSFYGLRKSMNFVHLDLLHFSRRAWGDDLLNCRLNKIERQILDLNRSVDIPSALVPEFYQTYRETGNPGPLIPILEHNKQDLLTLLKLFQSVYRELSSGTSKEHPTSN